MNTKYFPKTSILEAGSTAPEGTVVKQCESCKGNFAVTPEYSDATICETCAAKANAIAEMKSNTEKVISK